MGVFDYVRYEANCPHCGKRLTEFQTKDGDPYMNTVEPKDVWEWYALCGCGAFVTFAWQRAFDKPPRMTFDPPNTTEQARAGSASPGSAGCASGSEAT